MNDENVRIIEINGVKIEVDLRTAKRVDSYKVGDSVRLLTKNYNGYNVKYGVIVDFAEFDKLPTIEILALEPDAYASGGLQFYSFNAKTEDMEIAPLGYMDCAFKRDDILRTMNNEIETKMKEVETMRMKRDIFLQKFSMYFSITEAATA